MSDSSSTLGQPTGWVQQMAARYRSVGERGTKNEGVLYIRAISTEDYMISHTTQIDEEILHGT